MNLQTILADSKTFYRSHNLESWAKALPSAIKLSKAAEAQMARAEKLRLEQVLVFPDFKTQMTAIATVIAETAMKPVTGMYGCKIGSANKMRGANVTVIVPL